MKQILVTNDDGITTTGIARLAEAVQGLGEVTVVAPDREMSAISHALTLMKPLRVKEVQPRWFAVGGTPTDCVYLGIKKFVGKPVDLVVSGINRGANLAQDVHYSGTVAGAVEGKILGTAAIAFSQIINEDAGALERAVDFIRALAEQVLEAVDRGEKPLLNVNFPPKKAKGVKLTHLGIRHYEDSLHERVDENGDRYYWIEGSAVHYEQTKDTDCQVAEDGYISVTPLQLDLSDYHERDEMRSWPMFRDK